MNEAKALLIVNPKSPGGKTATAWDRVRKSLGEIRVLQTTAPGHAIQLTATALKNGASTVIAVGGDGTINEVVNGFINGGKPINPAAVLGIVPAGTSSDLRRSLSLPIDYEAAAFVIRNGLPRAIHLTP